MNKPPSGNSYRLTNSESLMFKPSAHDVPNMSIKINPGSFWMNNQFIEYAGGSSPKMTPPKTGGKWVFVVINKLGVCLNISGPSAVNNPQVPELGANLLPIAAVFLKSGTQKITNDCLFDVRPNLAACLNTQTHNNLQNRNVKNAHTIDSITDLTETLANKVSINEINDLLFNKANIDGTPASHFVLNQDETGTPVEYCGLEVHRGDQPSVGLRFNEDTDSWQYTNDGTNWCDFGTALDTSLLANSFTIGKVQLSVDPDFAETPIAVGINDPLYKSIENKIDSETLADYVTRSYLSTRLDAKADTDSVYSKADAERVFITRAEHQDDVGYSKTQIDAMMSVKANAAETYTKYDVNTLLSTYYTQTEIDSMLKALVLTTPGNSNGYTKLEIDNLFNTISNTVYTKSEVETKLATKSNALDVYTKAEVDNLLANVKPIQPGTSSPTDTYTKSEIDLLIKTHAHTAHSISDDNCHRFVTDEQITKWNNAATIAFDSLKNPGSGTSIPSLGYTAENVANKGQANGYASLDSNGKVPLSQLPSTLKNSVRFVNSYADMANLTDLVAGTIIYVMDASADTSVDNGWAGYVFDSDGGFHKFAEQESMDIVLDWSNITNKPTEFTPDSTIMADYATKAELNNYIDNATLNTTLTNYLTNVDADTTYVKETSLNTKIQKYFTDNNISTHNANQLGSYVVNETGIADGAALVYDSKNARLIYKKIEATGGSAEPVSVDYYNVGSKYIDETNIANNYGLVYNSATQKLVYKSIDNTINNIPVDTTRLTNNSILQYKVTSGKFELSALPSNLLDIDNTNRADGKLLAYNAEDGNLQYVDPPKTTAVEGDTVYTYVPTGATSGATCIVRANKDNAVTFTKSNNSAIITPGNGVRMISAIVKFAASDIIDTTLTINFDARIGDTDWDNMFPPEIQLLTGTPGAASFAYASAMKFNYSVNAHTVKFTGLTRNTPYMVRITY